MPDLHMVVAAAVPKYHARFQCCAVLQTCLHLKVATLVTLLQQHIPDKGMMRQGNVTASASRVQGVYIRQHQEYETPHIEGK